MDYGDDVNEDGCEIVVQTLGDVVFEAKRVAGWVGLVNVCTGVHYPL